MPATKTTFGPEGEPYWAIPYKPETGFPTEQELRDVFTGMMDTQDFGTGTLQRRIRWFVEQEPSAAPPDLLARVGALALFIADADKLVDMLREDLDDIKSRVGDIAQIRDDSEIDAKAGDDG